jgi:hypothetical protein
MSQRGIVSIETLLALLPVLFTFLGVMQLSLFLMGKLVVQHAAGRAVRSAVVVLDDDPKYYDGAKRYNLEEGAASEEGGFVGILAALNEEYGHLLDGGEVQGGARLQAIRQAAYHPLAILAPNLNPEALLSGEHPLGWTSLREELTESPWLRMGVSSLFYNRGAASVTVELESGGPVTKDDDHAPVVVRVHYLLTCGVPLVNRIMCHSGYELLQASVGILPSPEATEILGNLQNVASPLLRDAIFTSGARFALISAEAVLPNQGAPYH